MFYPLSRAVVCPLILVFSAVLTACSEYRPTTSSIDSQLREALSQASIHSAQLPVQTANSYKIQLGQLLFFEKLISGNQDIACSTCHHPTQQTGDGLALSIGTRGAGVGPQRIKGIDRPFIPRNSPDLFNRGHMEWHFLFWDGRVAYDALRGFTTPAGNQLPPGLESVLAAQALFPPTSRDEMRGKVGDMTNVGTTNELALYSDADYQGIWNGIVQRLLAISEYQTLFTQAYPATPINEMTMAHVGNAIAAFQIDRWTFFETPFDRYLAGENASLTAQAKRGALLFYGEAGCSECHSGILFTDQKFHNVAVPQLGPGKDGLGLDTGRILETSKVEDKYSFRTPSLRNVTLTGPWLHNGAYNRLEDTVRHMVDPRSALMSYNATQLPADLQLTIRNDAFVQNDILLTLDPLMETPRLLSETEIQQLMAFLESLTDPAAMNLAEDVPSRLPSGLPIDL